MKRIAMVFAWLLSFTIAASASAGDAAGLLDEIDRVTTAPASQPIEASAETSSQGISGFGAMVWFFAPTLAVTTAVGICGGVLGTFVVRRDESLLALALPQAVAVGAAVGLRFGWPELPPAIVATLIALGLFVKDKQRRRGRPNAPTLTPAVYISALCVAFLLVAHGGQHVEELQNLFTGIDVAVTPGQAWVMTPLLMLCAVTAACLWRRWLLLAQMPTAAELSGVAVSGWQTAFLTMLAAYVLLGTATQGVVLVLAMLFLPVAVVGHRTRRVPASLVWAVVVSLLMTGIGFILSYAFSWPLSHSVGGVGFGLLLLSELVGATQYVKRPARRTDAI